jgi:tRNA-specific 2-thiouridylase
MTKAEVREAARRFGLDTAEKPESQEICFVPDGDYAAAVERIRPDGLPGAGEIVDETGAVLGEHRGIHHFTVGQRRGLGVSAPQPLYVSAIEASANRVVVGGVDRLQAAGARLERVSWVAGSPPQQSLEARVKIRHRDSGALAEVEPLPGGRAQVTFDEAARAVTPGQAAVFYDGDSVLGGGWISESVP